MGALAKESTPERVPYNLRLPMNYRKVNPLNRARCAPSPSSWCETREAEKPAPRKQAKRGGRRKKTASRDPLLYQDTNTAHGWQPYMRSQSPDTLTPKYLGLSAALDHYL